MCLFQVKELEEALQMERLRPAAPQGLEQTERKDTRLEALQVRLQSNSGSSLVQAVDGKGTLCGHLTAQHHPLPLTILPAHPFASFPSFFSLSFLSFLQHKLLQAEEGRRVALKEVSKLKDEIDDLKLLLR